MEIGRSDERNTPNDARAHCDTAWLLRVRSRKPSGPAVMTPHRKAGHMIAPDPAPTLLQSALETRGPSTHVDRHFGRRTSLYPLYAGDRSHCIWGTSNRLARSLTEPVGPGSLPTQ